METRYTLSKNERLCSKKQIDHLFNSGRWLRSEHLRLVYLQVEKHDIPAQIVFSVPKKYHRKAVKRNLLKRRLREVYRLYKPKLYKSIEQCENQILLGVVFSTPEVIDYKTIELELKYLFVQLSIRLSGT